MKLMMVMVMVMVITMVMMVSFLTTVLFRVQVHDLQDILGVDRDKMEVFICCFLFCGDSKDDDDSGECGARHHNWISQQTSRR